MKLNFTKMHGLGNDFIVIDGVTKHIELSAEQIQQLADRKFGIGFDQLLLVEPPLDPEQDFRYRIFNADGYEVEQCGNGARCFALFVLNKGLAHKSLINVETINGHIQLQITDNKQVTVNMGPPDFIPAHVPFITEQESSQYVLTVDNKEHNGSQEDISFSVVSVGNPHAVITVSDIDTAPVQSIGPALESHKRFPKRVNVGFMEVVNKNHIKLRVYERGAGETLACGTGACAAVAVGVNLCVLESPVTVDLRGGQLNIEYQGGNSPILMTGPAVTVFEGTTTL
ncbi:MAG TPA: diaminopimelate epimerase [Pseudomonadales bacterium]